MVTIRYKDEFLDMPQGKISFEINFGGLDEESIKQSFSFPNNFPATPKNDRIFGFSRMLNSIKRVRSLPVELYMGGNFYKPATILFSEIDNRTYRGSVIITEFFIEASETRLSEINYGPDRFIGNTKEQASNHAQLMSLFSRWQPGLTYTFFPVYNPTFYGGSDSSEPNAPQGSNPEYENIINRFGFFDGQWTFAVNEIPPGGEIVGNKNVLIPFLYVHFVLDAVFKHFGFQLSGEFFRDEEMRQLTIYNNFSLEEKRKYRYVRAYINSHFSGGGIQPYRTNNGGIDVEDAQNQWSNSTFKYSLNQPGDYSIRITGTLTCAGNRQINIGALYESSGQFTHADDEIIICPANTPVPFEVVFTREIEVTAVSSGATISILFTVLGDLADFTLTESYVEIRSFKAEQLNQYAKHIKYSNHVPDITVNSFLNEIRKAFGLNFEFNPINNIVQLNYIKDNLNSQIVVDQDAGNNYRIKLSDTRKIEFTYNWSNAQDELTQNEFTRIDLSSPKFKGFTKPSEAEQDDVYVDRVTSEAFIFNQGNWQFLTYYFPSQVFGEGARVKTRSIQMLPLLMTVKLMEGSNILMPQIKQSGTSVLYELKNTLTSFRCVFYRGHQPRVSLIQAINNFPVASSFSENYPEEYFGKYNLCFHDTKDETFDPVHNSGTISLFLKEYKDLIVNSDLIIRKLPFQLIDIINLDFKKKYKIDGAHYFITKLQFECENDIILAAEAEMYKEP